MNSILPRLCGLPQPGKVYTAVDVDGEGFIRGTKTPIFAFAVDPTVALGDDFDISAQGMELRQRYAYDKHYDLVPVLDRWGKPIYDLYDWIGENNYPNPTDWLEEVMHQGFHQLVQRTLDFKLLSSESNYFAIHARAGICDAWKYWTAKYTYGECPLHIDVHDHISEQTVEQNQTCFRLLYADIIGGEPVKKAEPYVQRKLPSMIYTGQAALPSSTEHYPAIFFRLPIGKLGYWKIYKNEEPDIEKEALKALDELDAKLKNIKIVQL